VLAKLLPATCIVPYLAYQARSTHFQEGVVPRVADRHRVGPARTAATREVPQQPPLLTSTTTRLELSRVQALRMGVSLSAEQVDRGTAGEASHKPPDLIVADRFSDRANWGLPRHSPHSKLSLLRNRKSRARIATRRLTTSSTPSPSTQPSTPHSPHSASCTPLLAVTAAASGSRPAPTESGPASRAGSLWRSTSCPR